MYTQLTLFALGLLGVILHNLIQLDKLNKASNGTYNIIQYLRLELYSILISMLVVLSCVLISQEIQQLEQAGKWLGAGFIAIGYLGQSLLVWWIGKAEKIISSKDKSDE